MSTDLTDLQLLRELEPVVEPLVDRHMRMKKDWNPHDFIPWSDGKNYYALGGQDWDIEQSKLSEVARVAMLTNLLTEDNLPIIGRIPGTENGFLATGHRQWGILWGPLTGLAMAELLM